MWPFTKTDPSALAFRRIDADFAVSGQILPQQLQALADAGFKSVLCARPDNEEQGQPGFRAISVAAEAVGLKTVHIPVSGQLTESNMILMEQALAELPRPIFGYCRSGARAASLYAAAQRNGR